ncbi:autotransporter outer membrane beta-barrel domain-containing protein, partial [Rickettsiales bacterium]|nr:autotransporter outer membrane beta-barrel domain-containing protein [Rickettsiales bacterium]
MTNNETVGNDFYLEDNSTATTITNNGDVGVDFSLEYNSKATTITNNGDVGVDFYLEYNSKATTMTNNGTVGVVFYLDNSTAKTMTNNGDVVDDFLLYYSTATTVTNNGIVGYDFYLDDSTATTMTNNGTVIDNFYLDDSISTTVTNNGIVGDDFYLEYNSTATTMTNNGTVGDDFYLYNSTATTMINNGIVGDDFSLMYNSTATTMTNNGAINGSVSFYGLSTIKESFNNNGIIMQGIDHQSNDVSNIINSGTILAGANNIAISYYNITGDNNLTLAPGSKIIGDIYYNTTVTGINTINIKSGPQSSSSYSYKSLGTPVIVNIDSGLLAINQSSDGKSGKIIVADTSSISVSSDMSVQPSIEITKAINNRLSTARLEDSKNANSKIRIASNSNDLSNLGINFNKNNPYFWSEILKSKQKRDSYKNNQENKSNSIGAIVGFDKAIDSNKRVGGFLGGIDNSVNIGKDITSQIQSKGVFVGGYLSLNNKKSYFTDLSLTIGFMENESNRLVNELTGTQTARAEYNSAFFTPSITLGKEFSSLIASITARYTGQFTEGYKESGTDNSNMSIGKKYTNVISSRLELETNNHNNMIINNGKYFFTTNLRAGIEADRIIGSSTVDITLLGQSVKFTPSSRSYNIDGFIGFNANFNVKDNMQLYVDAELVKGLHKNLSNNNRSVYGKAGFKYQF